jgi:hypothetical protein
MIVTAERRVALAWTFAIVSALPLLFLAGLGSAAAWLVNPWLIVLAIASVIYGDRFWYALMRFFRWIVPW